MQWMCLSVSAKFIKSRCIDEIAIRSFFSTTKQTRYFDFIATNAENSVSHKYGVPNGSNTFKALFDKV